MTTGAEKRQHHRFLARLEVRVVSGERLPAGLVVSTSDVGVGGLRCASSHRLDVPVLLHMTLTLVGGDLNEPVTLNVDAQVLRCVERPQPHHGLPYDVAMQFVRLDPRDRRRLQSYLNSL